MPTFKLVKGAGLHIVGKRQYKAGQTVVSQDDLVKLFPGKFEQLDGNTDRVEAPSQTHTPYDTDRVNDTPPAPDFENEGELDSGEGDEEKAPRKATQPPTRRTRR